MKLLFLCTHNACRSVLAESIARQTGEHLWTVASAGSQPAGQVHPDTLAVLIEKKFPVEGLSSKSWDEVSQFTPDAVITVCDQAAGESCPVWFGSAVKAHWGLPDPTKHADPAQRRQLFEDVIATLHSRLDRLAAFLTQTSPVDKDQLQSELQRLGEN
ncbi:MAG: arsenate reductase ArsC [Gammaproteobacteria bacterium]|nr:arsenate reductase ArsC [Gammaproteobacteria bacterium]